MSILLTNVYEALWNTDNNKIGCAVCMEIQPNAFDFDCNNFTFTFEQCERWKYRLTENKRREKKKIDMRWQPSFMLYIQPAKGNPNAIVFFFCSFAYSLWSTQAIGLLVGLQPAYKSSGAVKWKSWIVSLYVNAVGAITFTICNRSTSASFVYLHQRQRQFFNAAAALLSLSPSTDKLVAASAWRHESESHRLHLSDMHDWL